MKTITKLVILTALALGIQSAFGQTDTAYNNRRNTNPTYNNGGTTPNNNNTNPNSQYDQKGLYQDTSKTKPNKSNNSGTKPKTGTGNTNKKK
jgi:hypothetical protein